MMELRVQVAVAGLIVSWVTGPAEAADGQSRKQILRAAADQAHKQLAQSSRSGDEYLRANAIEAMQFVPQRALPMIQLGLGDSSPVVRFTSLVLVGKLGMRELGPATVEYLADPSPSVRAAAIYAARATGQTIDQNEIPSLLTHKSSTVRRNAAMVVGLMGDASAVRMLRDLSRAPLHTAHPAQQKLYRLQIAEAIVQLGDLDELNTLRAAAYDQFIEVRVLAITILGNLQDRHWLEAFPAMLKDPTFEVRLAAAATLARLGREDGLDVLLAGSKFDSEDVRGSATSFLKAVPDGQSANAFRRVLEDPEEQKQVAAAIRAQAAFGLGPVRKSRAAGELVRLLQEPDEQVRVAAAAAIMEANNRGSEGRAAR